MNCAREGASIGIAGENYSDSIQIPGRYRRNPPWMWTFAGVYGIAIDVEKTGVTAETLQGVDESQKIW